MPFIQTDYAALIYGVKRSALTMAVSRNSTRYTYTKYQNKLLFKVTPAQLRIALNKGLIDANIEVYNDNLTLIQDFFKTNSRRVNGKHIGQTTKGTNNGDVSSETIGCDSSSHDRDCDKECANYFGCTTKGAKRRRRGTSSGSVYATSSADATTTAYRDDRNDNDTWCGQTSSITTSAKEFEKYNVGICEKKGELDGRANFTASTSIGIYGDVCCSEGSVCELSKSARFVDRERNTNTCGTSASNDCTECDSRDCLGAADGVFYSVDDKLCNNDLHCVIKNGEEIGKSDNSFGTKKGQGAVDVECIEYCSFSVSSNSVYGQHKTKTNVISNVGGSATLTKADKTSIRHTQRKTKSYGQTERNDTKFNANHAQGAVDGCNSNTFKSSTNSMLDCGVIGEFKHKDILTNKGVINDGKYCNGSAYSSDMSDSTYTEQGVEKSVESSTGQNGIKRQRDSEFKQCDKSNYQTTKNGFIKNPSSTTRDFDEPSTLNECLNKRENILSNDVCQSHACLSIQLDTTQSKNIGKKELIYDVICEYARRGFSIKSACAKLGISRQQYYRLAKKYEENGILGFVDKRTIKKASRIGECIPDYLKEIALTLWRKSGAGGISYAELHEKLHERAKNYDYKGFLLNEVAQLFSVKTLQNYIENYKKEHLLEAVMVEQGEDKAKSYLQPAMGDSRARVSARNELWQIDSSKLDMFVIDDEGNEFRPDILSVVDVFSGRCVATLADKSNGLSLIRLLWKAISELGMPKKIKGDNGKDYLGSTFQHTLQKLNIAYENTPPYSGEKKAMVERHFKTLQHSFISFAPGYIGHNLAKREKIEQRTAKKDRKAKNEFGKITKTNQKNLLSFKQALNLLDDGVAKWNMQRHRVKSGVSRLDLWNSCTNVITKMTYEYFLARAGESIVKKVQKIGINLNKRTYISADMPQVGTELIVCINIDNVSELYMYSTKGEFLGIAYDKQIANISIEELKAHQKEFKKAQREVRKAIKKAELSEFTKVSAEYDLKTKEKEHNELLNDKNYQILDDAMVNEYKENKKILDEVRLSFEDYEISESKKKKGVTWESIFDDVNVG